VPALDEPGPLDLGEDLHAASWDARR